MQFPFIRFDITKQLLSCKTCESAKCKNVFTSGCIQLKTDAIKKHVHIKDHKFAIRAMEARESIQDAASKIADNDQQAIEVIMKNNDYLAKWNDPSSAINVT